MEETEVSPKALCALELQNIFLGKSCKYLFKSTLFYSWSQPLDARIPCYHPSPATTKVSSGEVHTVGSGNTCLVLRGQLCQMQAGTLTVRPCPILRATTAVFDLALLHKNNSQQLRVFPEHWGMSPPVPRLVRDSCPYKTPAATKPASVCKCSQQQALLSQRDSFSDLPAPSSSPCSTSSVNALITLSGIECLGIEQHLPKSPALQTCVPHPASVAFRLVTPILP